MRTKRGNLHLEIQTSRKSPVGLLRTSYYQEGKTLHTQHGRITGCTLNQLKLLQVAFREQAIPANSPEAFRILQSKEFGASFCLLEVLKKTGLDKAIYSRNEPWVQSVLAMIVGRIIYAGSKLSLCHQNENTSLWELCGIEGSVNVDRNCYLPMDQLLKRQKFIQKTLAQKHLSKGRLVLYDITSSYLEGDYNDSELVGFGYNRDGKRGHEQIVIGLVCNDEGCPVGVEVWPGNTKDDTTLEAKINEAKAFYGIDKLVFVGDRGMIKNHNLEKLSSLENLNTITTLTRTDIRSLLEKDIIQMELFDERNICEVVDPNNPKKRYCLCRNPLVAEKNKETRDALLRKIREAFERISQYKKAITPDKLGARVGKVLSQYKVGKYIHWEIVPDAEKNLSTQHKLKWSFNEEKIKHEKCLDGCYIVSTDVAPEDMSACEVVESYKKLMHVEQAFRSLKTVDLELRPIYHRRDDRIRAHVFLCMLSYYVQWHFKKYLKSLFNEGKGCLRRWTLRNAIETLKQLTRNKVEVHGTAFFQISKATPDQQRIITLLGIKIP